jgi:hypothetical protein
MIPKHTYLLTNTGWNIVQKLTIGQKIFGLKRNNLKLATITNIKKQQYYGDVYTINKSFLLPNTLLLTKAHRLQKIKNIKNIKNLTTPQYDYSGYTLNPITHRGTMFDTCLILKVIGYFVECGKLKQKNTIVFKNKELKLKAISKILNSLNIKNFLSINNRGLSLISYDRNLYNFLLQFGSERNKHIPRKFLNLDKYFIRYLLSAILNSSMSNSAKITKDYKLEPETRVSITTPSEKLVDNIHELIIKLGFYFNTTAIHRSPMKRVQYDPITSEGTPFFETRVSPFIKNTPITKNKAETIIYDLSTAPNLRLTLIRNQSRPLWVNLY